MNHPEAKRPTVVFEPIESSMLKSNPLGDPSLRYVPVYLPPSYDGVKRFPVIYLLSGFASTGLSFMNYGFGRRTVPEMVDKLIREGSMPETIVVMPDCMTRYGGSQYVDSAATGAYETYLIGELLDQIDRKFNTLPEARHRAVVGKSSGGFGALRLGMRHPDRFSAVACHSGDMDFELCYRPNFPSAARLLERYDGSIEAFFQRWESLDKKLKGEFTLLDIMAMAACYDPDPSKPAPSNMHLPFEPRTCQLIPERWERWKSFDPLTMLDEPRYQDTLGSLRLLYLDCGSLDEYNLQFGHRRFTARASELGILHQYEEFPDTHTDTSYRYRISLPLLAESISG
ncbi:MAG TPA: esterase [Chlorobaculum parvum]|uniref:Esterase n=1 Tax=Chlorobaculum parvum TaxID=274539 RepID=A0A7C5HMN9_9CHLB|nr:esterase [Chlorobaculum parvum]